MSDLEVDVKQLFFPVEGYTDVLLKKTAGKITDQDIDKLELILYKNLEKEDEHSGKEGDHSGEENEFDLQFQILGEFFFVLSRAISEDRPFTIEDDAFDRLVEITDKVLEEPTENIEERQGQSKKYLLLKGLFKLACYQEKPDAVHKLLEKIEDFDGQMKTNIMVEGLQAVIRNTASQKTDVMGILLTKIEGSDAEKLFLQAFKEGQGGIIGIINENQDTPKYKMVIDAASQHVLSLRDDDVKKTRRLSTIVLKQTLTPAFE